MPAHRKPSHLKIVSGTAQPCRMNPNEPKPARKKMPPPDHLSPIAKAAWVKFSDVLYRMGVLTEADSQALEALCQSYAELREARAALAAFGSLTYETANAAGGIMIRGRPEVSMISEADRRFALWVARFGLSPADRSRVSAALQEDRNPFSEFS